MKILLIDDDELILENFSMIINYRRPDIEVICASSGQEALELLPGDFDIILSDLKMPGMDGFTLKRELNIRGLCVPVVFVSAMPNVSNQLIGKQLGAVGFLSKPISGKELIDAIDRAYEYAQTVCTKPELLKPVAELLILQPGKDAIIKALSEDYTIGRNELSDIRITSSNKVSREHALLNRTQESYLQDNPEHHYRIIDYSRNGFSVNNRRVSGYYLLKHGDVISLPSCEIRYFVLLNEIPNPKGTTPT